MKPSIDALIDRVRKSSDPDNLGMILVHNGVVRGVSKRGVKVDGMVVSCDEEALKKVVRDTEEIDGVEAVYVWINTGKLKIGDDIMLVLVAGRYRSDVIPAFEGLIDNIKKNVIKELEVD